ncbi:MAG: hypothetical protein GXP05_07130 [Alphaproteobacteria bacterium]|nr:hypothetical protein [Alphaproteobacteria bacterium]
MVKADDAEQGDEAVAAAEIEVFYTFTWAPVKKRVNQQKPQKARNKPKRAKDAHPKTTSSRPPRREKPIDPDNPFAALLALKDKK